MGVQQPPYPKGLTFDDVLLLPGYADFTKADIDLSSQLTKKIRLNIPLVSSPMDTVTEWRLAVALAKAGGVGIIHRNLTSQKQLIEVKKVKQKGFIVGAAISTYEGFEQIAKGLLVAGADVLVIDTAHGNTKFVINTVGYIKKHFPNAQVIAGNIATSDGAKALINAGADGLRVGMGPGSICTTRVISGMGVPQITAITEVSRIAQKAGVPVMADGGVKQTGDVTKALAAGASTVMLGSMFAGTSEAPGKVIELDAAHTPARFRSILNGSPKKTYKFKNYRGMGSVAAMKKGGAERYGQNRATASQNLIAEGVEGFTPFKGAARGVIQQVAGGVRSGMYYIGAKSITKLWQKARFIEITQASLGESHPHDVLVSDPGSNYL